MATINDRIDRLEDAFISMVETQKEQTAILKQHTTLLQGVLETQKEHGAILQEHTAILQGVLETQKEHTTLLRSVVSTLQGHSADLTLIKEHLG